MVLSLLRAIRRTASCSKFKVPADTLLTWAPKSWKLSNNGLTLARQKNNTVYIRNHVEQKRAPTERVFVQTRKGTGAKLLEDVIIVGVRERLSSLISVSIPKAIKIVINLL